MRSLKKMLFAAVATMAIAAGVAVSPASATVPSKGFDTQEANVPYLAWRGEHIRLGYCDAGGRLNGLDVSWALEDWSGDPANGSVPVPQEMFGQRHTTAGCVYTDFVSQKAGVAFIKLVVSGNNGVNLFEKQFIAGWMDLGTPSVSGGGTFDPGSLASVSGCSNPTYAPCDPAKDPRHRIKVVVKGTIPLKANFNEWESQITALGLHLTTPGQLTLPDDWAAWAAVAARSWQDFDQAKWVTNWDIHDDLTTVEGHVKTGGTQCAAADEINPVGSTDAVDNCVLLSGGAKGPFSTVFGQRSGTDSVGPFDPLYPVDTLLSDGSVNAGDAPMPAAQIDVKIVPNSGLAGDISGVGFLFPSFKTQVYSRDGFGSPTAHNSDAPFYYQYIPATARPTHATSPAGPYGSPQASGIDGSNDPDGFTGFWWTRSTAYQNWEFATSTSFNPGVSSKCLQTQDPNTLAIVNRPLPSGINGVAVYTDEHGEANVNWVPGLGFFFDNVGALKAQGGCDLGLVTTLGTAHVTVQARYPYQPVTAADPVGTPVDFTVRNRFQKVLGDFGKGPGANNHMIRVVLAHAQEIDGSPIVGEFVCWSAQGASQLLTFPQGPNGEIRTGPNSDGTLVATINQLQAKNGTFYDQNGKRLCTTTDANGNTAIEVLNSEGGTVDVMAQFVHEVIFRDIPVNFDGQPTGSPGFPGNLGQDAIGTQVPTPTQIKASLTANAVGPVLSASVKAKTKVLKSHKAAKVLHKIRFARVLMPFHGKRSLQVRVNGVAGKVGLRITIRFGGKNHVYVRHVPVNRKVSIKNLPLPAKVVHVTVKLIGR